MKIRSDFLDNCRFSRMLLKCLMSTGTFGVGESCYSHSADVESETQSSCSAWGPERCQDWDERRGGQPGVTALQRARGSRLLLWALGWDVSSWGSAVVNARALGEVPGGISKSRGVFQKLGLPAVLAEGLRACGFWRSCFTFRDLQFTL